MFSDDDEEGGSSKNRYELSYLLLKYHYHVKKLSYICKRITHRAQLCIELKSHNYFDP